jgi:hypothetical protein
MKKIFRFVGLGGLLTAFFAVGAVASFAQDPCADVDAQNASYQDILGKYKSTDPAVLGQAIDSAKGFLEKYGSCEAPKAQVDWMKANVPKWEARKTGIVDEGIWTKLLARFNEGYKSSNWDEVYASGKEIMASPRADDTVKLDVTIVLAYTGFDQATKKNNKFNDEAISYAKSALQKMDSGVASKNFGVAFPNANVTFGSKANAVGWMNLTIGYITYNAKNDPKGGLGYLYHASQNGPETSVNPVVYDTIGRYFYGEAGTIAEDIKALAAKVSDADPDDVKAQKQTELKAKKALFNGTAERAMDAYSRAYKFAKADQKAFKDSTYQKIQALYKARFDKTDGLDGYIASTTAKPLADPTSPVTPIEDPEVKADTTKTSSTPAPSATPTKPAETSGVTKSAVAKKANP